MELPACFKGVVNSQWVFENNWGWQNVKLSHQDSATSINISKLFKPFENEFLKAEASEVPDADVAPGDSVSQVGSGVSQTSTPSQQSTASAKVTASPAKLRKVLKSQFQAAGSPPPPDGSGMAGSPAQAPGTE